jgi:hypothetical protein
MMPGTEKGCPGTPAGKVIRKAASRAPNGLPGPGVKLGYDGREGESSLIFLDNVGHEVCEYLRKSCKSPNRH